MSSVLFVCLGNICRSPMAHGILQHRAVETGLEVEVDSCGTGAWHAGEPPDPRTMAVLAKHGIALDHRARRLTAADFERFDRLLVMDHANYRDVMARCPEAHADKVALALEPTGAGEVPDPYYGGPGGFDHVYRLLSDAMEHWMQRL